MRTLARGGAEVRALSRGWLSWSRSWSPLWIALAAFLAVLPLIVRGISCGHDLSFHLLNWMEVGAQWRQGTLRPMWCFHAAWNAGEPRFVFYPPASWVLGATLGMVLPWAAVPVVYTFAVLLLCGWSMRRLLRPFVPEATAVLGGCVYLANPYMLFTAFERCAYAELLAAAWMPLMLSAALRARLSVARVGVVVALLWLTNAPGAVVGSYSLLVIGLVRCGTEWRRDGFAMAAGTAARMAGGYGLGVALAGFYLLPVAVQRKLVQVQMAFLPGMRPVDNFLFDGRGDPGHVAVLRTASWISVGVLAVALVCLAVLLVRWRSAKRRTTSYASMHDRGAALRVQARRHRGLALTAFAVLTPVMLFLLTPWSAFVWRHAPELTFLQFPWRFLAMEGAVAVALLTLTLPRQMEKRVVLAAALVFALAAGWAGNSWFRQDCDEEDTVAAQRENFVRATGSEPTDEYTPVAADNDALKRGLPAGWVAEEEDGGPGGATASDVVTVEDGRAADLHFIVRAASSPRFLVVRLRQFAGWRTTVDGREWTGTSARNDGLLAVPLTGGAQHEVEVHSRYTVDEWAGVGISAAGCFVLLGFLWRRERAGLRERSIPAIP